MSFDQQPWSFTQAIISVIHENHWAEDVTDINVASMDKWLAEKEELQVRNQQGSLRKKKGKITIWRISIDSDNS